jgi:hypothetical protein
MPLFIHKLAQEQIPGIKGLTVGGGPATPALQANDHRQAMRAEAGMVGTGRLRRRHDVSRRTRANDLRAIAQILRLGRS